MSDSQKTAVPIGEPYVDEKRHDHLKGQLASTIKEVAALKPEIILNGAETFRYSLEFQLKLTPGARTEVSTYYGDRSGNSRLCRSQSDVQHQAMMHEAKCKCETGREAATELGRRSPLKLFRDAGDKTVLPLPVGNSFSFVYACPQRGCRSGRVACPSCGGSGNRTVTEQVVTQGYLGSGSKLRSPAPFYAVPSDSQPPTLRAT